MHELLRLHPSSEQSVRRCPACFALVLVVLSLLAIGGTFGGFLMPQLAGRREAMMLHAQLEEERARAEQAMAAERAARQEAERALQAERAARQQ